MVVGGAGRSNWEERRRLRQRKRSKVIKAIFGIYLVSVNLQTIYYFL